MPAPEPVPGRPVASGGTTAIFETVLCLPPASPLPQAAAALLSAKRSPIRQKLRCVSADFHPALGRPVGFPIFCPRAFAPAQRGRRFAGGAALVSPPASRAPFLARRGAAAPRAERGGGGAPQTRLATAHARPPLTPRPPPAATTRAPPAAHQQRQALAASARAARGAPPRARGAPGALRHPRAASPGAQKQRGGQCRAGAARQHGAPAASRPGDRA